MTYISVRRRKRRKKSSILPILLLIGIGCLSAFAIFYQKTIYEPLDAKSTIFKKIDITKDMNGRDVTSLLQKEGVIRSEMTFSWFLQSTDLSKSIKAGTYALSPSQTVPEIIDIIVEGKTTKQWLTFPEGWRVSQYATRLHANNIIDGDKFLQVTNSPNWISPERQQKWWFLKHLPQNASLEGYLFPDTYLIDPIIEAKELVSLLLNTMQQKLEPIKTDILSSNRTMHEILTIASIIERESTVPEDRRKISDVLWKRLDNGISLGADPTVLYILGDWKAPLTKETLDTDSPYNTRKYRGLPPGPICSPSLDSIKAALYPEKTPYWYFLATKKTGTVIYSKTLEEHNRNKQRYL